MNYNKTKQGLTQVNSRLQFFLQSAPRTVTRLIMLELFIFETQFTKHTEEEAQFD